MVYAYARIHACIHTYVYIYICVYMFIQFFHMHNIGIYHHHVSMDTFDLSVYVFLLILTLIR